MLKLGDFENPFDLFTLWYSEAADCAGVLDHAAVALASVGADGFPENRTMLMKQYSGDGFVFFTNKTSQKAANIEANPKVSMLFYWASLGRQIRIKGEVVGIRAYESDEYFQERDYISKIGAWGSMQSSELGVREELLGRVEAFKSKFPDYVPRPSYWQGFRLVPSEFEFWEDMPHRLHNRLKYRLIDRLLEPETAPTVEIPGETPGGTVAGAALAAAKWETMLLYP